MTRTRSALLLLFASACVIGSADRCEAASRQYYSNWQYSGAQKYHFRTYYYKPTPTYPTFQKRYCIFHPDSPRYVYYFNPYKNAYLGRFDLEATGEKRYSKLADGDQKARLKDIPDSAFPALDQMPVIPGAEDGVRMAPLPAGLPKPVTE